MLIYMAKKSLKVNILYFVFVPYICPDDILYVCGVTAIYRLFYVIL